MAEVVIKEKVKDVNVAEFVGKIIARRETERCLTVFFRCTTQQGARTYTNSMKILSFSQDFKKVPAAALTQLILIRIVLIKRSKDRSVQCTQIKRVLLSLFVFQ